MKSANASITRGILTRRSIQRPKCHSWNYQQTTSERQPPRAHGWISSSREGGATTTTITRYLSQSQTTDNEIKSHEHSIYHQFLQDVAPTAWRSIGIYELLEPDPPMNDLFRSVIEEYVKGVTREIEFRAMMESLSSSSSWNVSILLRAYENHRSTSAAVIPTLIWGHFLTRNPLEEAPNSMPLYQDKDFRRFLRIAALIAGIDNDIMSYQKDDSWDYITIYNRFGNNNNNNHTLDEAVEKACQRHHELIQEWKVLGEQLQSKYIRDMQPWKNIICPAQWQGFVAWQSLVQRYKVKQQQQTEESPSLSENSIESLWQRLFGNDYQSWQTYVHDIPTCQHTIREEIREDTLRWARACGLVGETHENQSSFICSEAKLLAIDPALLTILLFHYHRGESDLKALKTFSKFFMFLILYDDIMEKPEVHETAKEILLDILYP